ncbi:endolytic transglycosylase MltG, partial [uncultured Acinetobacter sp.]
MSSSRSKTKKKNKPRSPLPMKGILTLLLGVLLIVVVILWSSLFKDYPVKGQKELLAIGDGDTYSGFIDRLEKNDQVSFPIILKLYQKIMIHDSMKAGVYEIQQGMSIREVMEMISNAENAQMNRILVIEGTTFKQLVQHLQKDELVTKEVSHLPTDQLLKALNIPFEHPEGLFAPDTYFFAKGESDRKILTDLYQRQMKALDEAWANRAPDLPYKNKY